MHVSSLTERQGALKDLGLSTWQVRCLCIFSISNPRQLLPSWHYSDAVRTATFCMSRNALTCPCRAPSRTCVSLDGFLLVLQTPPPRAMRWLPWTASLDLTRTGHWSSALLAQVCIKDPKPTAAAVSVFTTSPSILRGSCRRHRPPAHTRRTHAPPDALSSLSWCPAGQCSLSAPARGTGISPCTTVWGPILPPPAWSTELHAILWDAAGGNAIRHVCRCVPACLLV